MATSATARDIDKAPAVTSARNTEHHPSHANENFLPIEPHADQPEHEHYGQAFPKRSVDAAEQGGLHGRAAAGVEPLGEMLPGHGKVPLDRRGSPPFEQLAHQIDEQRVHPDYDQRPRQTLETAQIEHQIEER